MGDSDSGAGAALSPPRRGLPALPTTAARGRRHRARDRIDRDRRGDDVRAPLRRQRRPRMGEPVRRMRRLQGPLANLSAGGLGRRRHRRRERRRSPRRPRRSHQEGRHPRVLEFPRIRQLQLDAVPYQRARGAADDGLRRRRLHERPRRRGRNAGNTGSIFVAGLDAIGRPLWAKSYRLPNDRSIAFAGLRLTNDGGVVVSGVAEHAYGARAEASGR